MEAAIKVPIVAGTDPVRAIAVAQAAARDAGWRLALRPAPRVAIVQPSLSPAWELAVVTLPVYGKGEPDEPLYRYRVDLTARLRVTVDAADDIEAEELALEVAVDEYAPEWDVDHVERQREVGAA